MKALELLKCFKSILSLLLIKNWYFVSYGSLVYKQILSISGSSFIRLVNEFVFLDRESPIVNILYGWSGTCGQFGLCSSMFSFLTSSKLMILCTVFIYRYN